MKHRIVNLITPWHQATVFEPIVWNSLCDLYEVIAPSDDSEADALLPDCDFALTGWGTNFTFTPARIQGADRLRLIAHSAGSVKKLFPDAAARSCLRTRGIAVFSGGEGLAINVAEATIGYLIASMRRWPEHSRAFPAHRRPGISLPGDDPPRNGQYLTGATIGLVGLSTVARLTLPLLTAFGCRILVYDPYLCADSAKALGVARVELDDLFRLSDAVSLHAPELPETRGLIGGLQLRQLRDGGTLVNTARGSILDHQALFDECRDGRISAALDVTEPEPLPPESPLWKLPNVTITPHIAAQGTAGLFHIGRSALAAVQSACAGRPVDGVVPLDRWEMIA